MPPKVVAPAPSLADVMAEQLQEAESAAVVVEPPKKAAVVPEGMDPKCKVAIGRIEIVGAVLGSSRAHISDMEKETGLKVKHWNDDDQDFIEWISADTPLTHLWVVGSSTDAEVRHLVARLEDHVASILERKFGPAAVAQLQAEKAAESRVTSLTDLASPPQTNDASAFPKLQSPASPESPGTAWPELPPAVAGGGQGGAKVKVNAALFEGDSSEENEGELDLATFEKMQAEKKKRLNTLTQPDKKPEPNKEDKDKEPAEDSGPAPWELETQRIREEQRAALEARKVMDEEAEAAAAASQSESDEESRLDAAAEAAEAWGAELKADLTAQFERGVLPRKELRKRAATLLNGGVKGDNTHADVDAHRVDEKWLIDTIVAKEVELQMQLHAQDASASESDDEAYEEAVAAVQAEAEGVAAALEKELDELVKNGVSNKELRKRASAARGTTRKHGTPLDPDVEAVRNDEKALVAMIIEAEVENWMEKTLDERLGAEAEPERLGAAERFAGRGRQEREKALKKRRKGGEVVPGKLRSRQRETTVAQMKMHRDEDGRFVRRQNPNRGTRLKKKDREALAEQQASLVAGRIPRANAGDEEKESRWQSRLRMNRAKFA